MFTRAMRVASIGGIEVRLDPSVLVLAALVTWVFNQWFRGDFPTVQAVTMAAVGAVLVLVTTFAHELAHALEARHRGLEVTGITLFLFGGVTEMHAHGQTARDELAVAAVGPYVSLVCGAVFGIIATFAGTLLPATAAPPVARVAGLLGWWNVLLAVFNLVPGAPLDGGRVLRAVLWMVLGDRMRALRLSVRAGQVLAGLLVAFGAWTLSRAPGAWVPAAAFALVGVFLWRAASSELRHARIDALIDEVTVTQLLGRPPAPIDAERIAAEIDRDREVPTDLVAVHDGVTLIGFLERDRLEHRVPAGSLAEPIDDVPAVRLDDDIHTLIERFQGEHHVVVVHDDDARVIGALTEREVARALQRLRADGRDALIDEPTGFALRGER
jgi:Zn-dependent protease